MLIIQNYEYIKIETLKEGLAHLSNHCLRYPSANCYVASNENHSMQSDLFRRAAEHCKSVVDVKVNGSDRRIIFPAMKDYSGYPSKIIMMDCKTYPSDPFFDRFKALDYFSGIIFGDIPEQARDMLEIRTGRQSRYFNLPGYIYTL